MLHGTHNSGIMALSVVIAVLSSYTALFLARHVRESKGISAYAWLFTAAVAMGGGIWSMHFVGMLALTIPGIPIRYDVRLTIFSLMIPIFVTGVGFWIVRQPTAGSISRVLSGIFMGVGIVAMHFVGMEAMQMRATLLYDSTLVIVSAAIAIAASITALFIAFREYSLRQKILAALAMGGAIAGMHYTAMAAALFVPYKNGALPELETGVDQIKLVLAVTVVTIVIHSLALVAAAHDSRSHRNQGIHT